MAETPGLDGMHLCYRDRSRGHVDDYFRSLGLVWHLVLFDLALGGALFQEPGELRVIYVSPIQYESQGAIRTGGKYRCHFAFRIWGMVHIHAHGTITVP